jgi:hypothetical protein
MTTTTVVVVSWWAAVYFHQSQVSQRWASVEQQEVWDWEEGQTGPKLVRMSSWVEVK